jgi:homocitrate synthase
MTGLTDFVEGEQFANAFFTLETKIKIAKMYVWVSLHPLCLSRLRTSISVIARTELTRRLDEFGVEYIELTSPAASPESRAHCEAICKLGLKRTKILTHIRCHMDDARLAVETGVDGVDVVIGTSSFLREHSHGKDMSWITKT